MKIDLLERIIREAEKMGADEAVAGLYSSRSVRAEVEHNEVKRAVQNVNEAFKVTVIVGKKIASAYTTVVSEGEALKAVEDAVRMARASKPNEYWSGLPEPRELPDVKGLYDEKVAGLMAGDVVEMAWEIVEAAVGYDPRVVTEGVVESSVTRRAMATSSGFLGEEEGTVIWGYALCVAKEAGEVGSFSFATDESRSLDVDFESVGRRGAKLAVETLGAKPIEPFKGTLIMDYDVVAQVLWALSMAYTADNVWKGSSPLKGKVGQQVLHESLTIKDAGDMDGGFNSSRFDAEGSPRRTTVVFERGVLKNYISNTYVANILGLEATGNAASLLTSAPTNTVVSPGDIDEEELIGEVKRGVYVRRFSGDMRFQDGVVSGVAKQAFYVENGELVHPVVGCMISANLYEMLRNVSGVGRKVEKRFGAYVPMIRVEDVAFISKR